MILSEEKSDVLPKCPHCSADLVKVFFREIQSFLGKRFIYFCPSCLKTLGVTHRKGFWMG